MKPLKFEEPLIMGHRGFQTHYPENTMVSFMAAVETGAQFVELDVTLTRDHQVAVIHDDTVDRTTNGIGPVHSFNLKELQKLDAGIRVFPYNIIDKKDTYRCFALGADGLIAKNPHLARQCYNRTHQGAQKYISD